MRRTTTIILALLLTALPGCTFRFDGRRPDPNIRLIAFGDSTTRGPAQADYAAHLPNLLALAADAVAIEGVSGETTTDGVTRLQMLIDRGLFPNAERLIYWQGGTDLIDFLQQRDPLLLRTGNPLATGFEAEVTAELDRIAAEITRAVQAAQSAGWRVHLVTYFPLRAGTCSPIPGGFLPAAIAERIDPLRLRLNERIRAVAAATGAGLIDVATISDTLAGDPDAYFDCNHLSASGNAAVAQFIAAALNGG